MQSIGVLGDDALLASLHELVRRHRGSVSGIIAHLGEVEARRLHAVRGHSSLFVYCLKELGFSEDEACRRIDAARLARRFPVILESLATGTVSLSVLGLLKHRMDEANHVELLAGVARKSVAAAKEWLASRFPLPDVPDDVRKLPVRTERKAVSEGNAQRFNSAQSTLGLALPVPVPPSAPITVPSAVSLRPSPAAVPATPARVEPLSADRFAVKVSVSRAVRDKLERARDLARHRVPSGKLEELLELALDTLLDKLERDRFGKAARPRKPATSAHEPDVTRDSSVQRTASRAAPSRHVRREVVARDGERCAYVAPDGTRCECRAFLEFDHIEPVGLGGLTETRNLRLLCRAHNALLAELAYGKELIVRVKEQRRKAAQDSRRHSAHTPPVP